MTRKHASADRSPLQRASDAGESVLAREGTKDTRFGRQKRIGRLADTDGFMLRQQGRNLLAPGLPRQRLTIASENQVMPTEHQWAGRHPTPIGCR